MKMLRKLSVSNLAIVERAEAEFAPGLNVLTGETGAGKSVLMGALELVLGGRADSSVVRDGAKEAEVEAVFDDRVVRRTVTAAGRTRAWIDDESVSVAELRELGRTLVDIHGPRANQNVLEEAFQRATLDAYGRTDLAPYAAAFAAWRALRDRLAALLSAGGGEDELDLLRYQVNELEAAGVTADDDDLAERHAAAAHAEEIVAASLKTMPTVVPGSVKIVSQKDVNTKGVLSEFAIELAFAPPASADPNAKKPTSKKKKKGARR